MTRHVLARWVTGLLGIGAVALFACSAGADQLKIGILLPGSTADNGYNADGGRTAAALKSQLAPMPKPPRTSRSPIRPIYIGSMRQKDTTSSSAGAANSPMAPSRSRRNFPT